MLYFLMMLTTYCGSLVAAVLFYIWHITTIDALSTITRYPVLLSPTHLLYMFVFVLYFVLGYWLLKEARQYTPKRAILFSASMLLQIALFIVWHLELIRYMLLINILLMVTLFLLYRTYDTANIKERLPISLFFAWVSFSTIFIFELTVVFYSFHGFGLSKQLWVIVLLTTGAAIALHMRYHYSDRVFSIVFIVIYLSIGLHLRLDEMLVTLCTLFLSGVLVAGILYLHKNTGRL